MLGNIFRLITFIVLCRGYFVILHPFQLANLYLFQFKNLLLTQETWLPTGLPGQYD